jgi:hypothetical protein
MTAAPETSMKRYIGARTLRREALKWNEGSIYHTVKEDDKLMVSEKDESSLRDDGGCSWPKLLRLSSVLGLW